MIHTRICAFDNNLIFVITSVTEKWRYNDVIISDAKIKNWAEPSVSIRQVIMWSSFYCEMVGFQMISDIKIQLLTCVSQYQCHMAASCMYIPPDQQHLLLAQQEAHKKTLSQPLDVRWLCGVGRHFCSRWWAKKHAVQLTHISSLTVINSISAATDEQRNMQCSLHTFHH